MGHFGVGMEIDRRLLGDSLINEAFHKEVFFYNLCLTNPNLMIEYDKKQLLAKCLSSEESL
jgi:hypothetical protein